MKLSKIAIWFAGIKPGLTKCILWLWAQTYIRSNRKRAHAEHWLLRHLAELLNYRIPVTTRLGNGMKIKVAWNDHVGRHIYERGYYEEETVNVITALLRPGMVFFDVGAHVGQYTLTASCLVGEDGQVHSFEPDPDTFRWLAGNTTQNGLRNVHLNQLALCDETSTKELFLATAQDVGSNSLSEPFNYSGKKFTVRCTTVNEYIKAKNIERIDVMKMDIEGAEYAALIGASEILQGKDKPTLIIEFEERRQQAFGSSCRKLAELLKNNGYVVFVLGQFHEEYVPKFDDPPTFNVLAIPESKKVTVLAKLASHSRA
jgi:FkbM family methyltransferase